MILFIVQMARVIINGRVMNTTGDSKERGRPRRRKSSKARRTVARCRQSSLCVSRTATRRRCASHRGTKLNQWNEDDMKNAIKEWRSESKNSGRTVREIARTWNVPYATFRRRILNTNQLHAQHCSGGRQFLLRLKKMNSQLIYVTLPQLGSRVTALM